MKDKLTQLLLLTLLMATTLKTDAALCISIAENGEKVFRFVGGKETKTVSGYVSKFKLCPELPPVFVRKEIVEEYIVPNPQTACEKAAVHSCDPEWGGLPVCTTGNMEKFCGFCFVSTTDANGHNIVTRYLNGAPYDGSKSVNGVAACPQPVNK